MAEQIGIHHLADNPSLYEVQRNNNFEFIITDLNGIKRAGALGTESNAYISNAQEVLRIAVNKAFVPHFTQEVVAVKKGNATMKYAGVPTFGEGTVEINDYIGADAKSALMAWQNLSYDVDTEKVGSMSNPNTQYKKTCYLVEYTPDYRKVRTWVLYGCWVSGITEGEYSAEDGGKRVVSATVQYDWGKIDLSNTP